jgi:hypothetical protein
VVGFGGSGPHTSRYNHDEWGIWPNLTRLS